MNWRPLPKVLPPCVGTFRDLQVVSTPIRATEAGFDERRQPGRIRTINERRTWVKLLLLTRWKFGHEELMLSLGSNLNPESDSGASPLSGDIRIIENYYQGVRTRTLGPGSFSDRFVQSVVSRSNFEVHCTNLHIKKHKARVQAEAEQTALNQGVRMARYGKYRDYLQIHLERLHELYEKQLHASREGLTKAREQATSASILQSLERKVKHFEALHNVKWNPTDIFIFGNNERLPPLNTMYASWFREQQQLFWEERITKDTYHGIDPLGVHRCGGSSHMPQ